MTTVQDTLFYVDGRKVNGQIVLTWPIFQENTVTVAAGQQVYPIVDGVVSITLYPNLDAQPDGVYYTAAYELDEGARYEECWIVPALPTVTVGQIRSTFPIAPSLLINAMQLSSSGAAAGMFLGWNGNRWVPMFPGAFNSAVQSFGPPGAGRTGTVQPQSGDYTASMITGPALSDRVVPQSTQILPGYGMDPAGGGQLTGNVTLSVLDSASIQKIHVLGGGTLVGTRPAINFVAGDASMQISVGDDGPNNRVNVSLIAVGGGGGGGGTTPIYSVDGTEIGSEAGLNLISGAGVALSGSDNSGANNVDITVSAPDAVLTTGLYPNPSWIQTLAWGKLTGVPVLVNSFNGRSGAVLPAVGDYTAAQVTNAVSTIGSYADPAWITSLSWAKVGDPTTAKGDLIVRGASAPATHLAVGADGTILTADSTQTLGVKWAAAVSVYWKAGSPAGAIYYNAGSVGVGATTIPITAATAGRAYLTIEGTTDFGVLELASPVADAAGSQMGQICVTDPANNQTDKRIAMISIVRDGTTASNRGAAMQFYTKTDGVAGMTLRLIITNQGNVGIGTGTPSSPLSIVAATGLRVAVFDSGTSTFGIGIQPNVMQLIAPATSARVGIGWGTSASFTETLSVAGNSVGIGTTAPWAVLTINGGSTEPSLTAKSVVNATVSWLTELAISLSSAAGTPICLQGRSTSTGGLAYPIVLNPLGGNVGIGVMNPTQLLFVAGGAYCNGTTWTNGCDANLKTDFAEVDGDRLLATLAELPVREWSYRNEPAVRRVGPTAQDWHRLLGLGDSDTAIGTVEEIGVALAAVKALLARVQTLEAALRKEQS